MPATVVRVVSNFVEVTNLYVQLFRKFTSDGVFKLLPRLSMTAGQSPLAPGGRFGMVVDRQEEPVL
ncbi:MAG: hypothetical protein P8Y92_16335 [Halioglobus sp.]